MTHRLAIDDPNVLLHNQVCVVAPGHRYANDIPARKEIEYSTIDALWVREQHSSEGGSKPFDPVPAPDVHSIVRFKGLPLLNLGEVKVEALSSAPTSRVDAMQKRVAALPSHVPPIKKKRKNNARYHLRAGELPRSRQLQRHVQELVHVSAIVIKLWFPGKDHMQASQPTSERACRVEQGNHTPLPPAKCAHDSSAALNIRTWQENTSDAVGVEMQAQARTPPNTHTYRSSPSAPPLCPGVPASCLLAA